MLLVVLALNYAIFFLMPGDPVSLFVNPVRGSPEGKAILIERLKARWGLDKPPEQRFLIYVTNMLTWNFGDSIASGNPIASEMLTRLWYTIELMGGSAFFGILIGVALGVLVAWKRGGKFDNFMVTASLITYSLPVFWMGLVFILIFTLNLHWFPHANAFPYDWGLPGRRPIAYTVWKSVV